MDMAFIWGVMKMFGIRLWWCLHNNVNILKTTELSNLKWLK